MGVVQGRDRDSTARGKQPGRSNVKGISGRVVRVVRGSDEE